jgi:DNA-binding transcriptional LysR family regulator
MDTDRLRYFCVIAETGSLTAAAQILNVSHSGLSKAMTVLQAEIKLQLFKPLGRGLELTEAGKLVYQKSKPIIEALSNISNLGVQPEKPTIRIGLAEIFSIGLVGEIAEAIKPLNTRVDFFECDSGETETDLLEGKIDFGISFVPFPQNELEYLKIKKIGMGVFHANSKFSKMKLSEIPFVVPSSKMLQNPLSIKSRDGWPTELPRNAQFGASSLASALNLVDQGMAAVFMPRFLKRQYLEIDVKKNLFEDAERDVFLVKRKNKDENQAMKLVAKVIRKSCI